MPATAAFASGGRAGTPPLSRNYVMGDPADARSNIYKGEALK